MSHIVTIFSFAIISLLCIKGTNFICNVCNIINESIYKSFISCIIKEKIKSSDNNKK